MAKHAFENGLTAGYTFNCQRKGCPRSVKFDDSDTHFPHGVTGARRSARAAGWGTRTGQWYCPLHRKSDIIGS